MNELSIATPRVSTAPKVSLHRVLVTIAILTAIAIVIAITLFGFDYYRLGLADRPFSPKHSLLKPSGSVGLGLGLFGFALFCLIFLYALRKCIPWLARRGSAKHWLDFHVIAGTLAPVIIMFHASFKFQGIAGMAFCLMVAVALSGILGRYVYAQIPRTLNSVELSVAELEQMQASLAEEIAASEVFRPEDLKPLLRVPTIQQVRSMSALAAVVTMVRLDIARPFHVARLRAHALRGNSAMQWFGGFFASHDVRLETAIRNVRRRSALTKRVAFLGKTQRLFHLWHVIHRPFSYSFAVLAVIHLVVVFVLGYIRL